MQDDVTIWYRGANYQLGRGRHGYGIWSMAGPPGYPLEQWPETPQGWAAAWSRFTAIEHPGAITHLAPPPVPAAPQRPAVGAAVLLGAGVVCGIIGLFPTYMTNGSLASQPANLIPHILYLAAWLASAALILTTGSWRRTGALLGLGTSVITFGFFLTDFGSVLADGTSMFGSGLALGLIGWLLCTTGSVMSCWPGVAGLPRLRQARSGRTAVTLAVTAVLAIGTAITFAPSWDSYTLRTPSGVVQTVTAGNIFSDPGWVIVGNFAVMVVFVLVAIAAVVWKPARLGPALLVGALIPMAAQAVSALVQIGEAVSPLQFGVTPGRAAQLDLTITSGLTPVFWIYLVTVILLAGVCVSMQIAARPRRPAAAPVMPTVPAPAPVPWQAR